MSAAVKRMQVALANLRLWVELAGNEERPSIHPERVIEAIGALEAGLSALRGEPAAEQESTEVMLAEMDEEDVALVDEEAMIAQIQEAVIKQGVALPADVIAMVLEAEEEYLYNRGIIPIDFVPEEEADDDEEQ